MARPPSRAGEATEAQGVLQAQHIQILKRSDSEARSSSVIAFLGKDP